ncbi:MAG TPA: sigma-70 family RNA polymerase sigma factor [Polyangiaceae bacterium]|nr:sigma-70 family RNA polymerase sigma factor [Polyangiaceae bacterium]
MRASAEPAATESSPASGVMPTFEAVYEAHVDHVWRAARRLGVAPASLEDIVQEVFIVVHRKLATFEGRSSLETWLYGITLMVVRNHRRSRRRKPLDVGEGAEIALNDAPISEREQPDALAERRRAGATVHDVLDRLPEDLREALVMAELEGMSGPEIAEVTGLGVATVYGRIRKARAKFDEALKRHLEERQGSTP